MNKYKYQTSDKANQEIWICEACKKGKIESILTGKWKLIDRSTEPGVLCAVCEGVGGSVAVKEGTLT